MARLPGFRNVLIHHYVGLDYELVVAALDRLNPVRTFLQVVIDRIDAA